MSGVRRAGKVTKIAIADLSAHFEEFAGRRVRIYLNRPLPQFIQVSASGLYLGAHVGGRFRSFDARSQALLWVD